MAKIELARVHSKSTGAKFAFAALFALSLLLAQSFLTSAYADKKPDNKPTVDPCLSDKKPHGCLKLSTRPGGNPVLIDGKDAGETTENDRYINLAPGLHTVEILFPNGERWTHDINVSPRRIYCIGLDYAKREISIPPSKPLCRPYSVNISAPGVVNDGEVITFQADVKNYTGANELNYTWTVSPSSARIVSGAGTPRIEVETAGLNTPQVTAILVVDDGSGESLCRVTREFATNINPILVKTKCFDCFPPVSFDDTKARLDNFAIELQNNPSSQGYIIIYGGANSRAGQADALLGRSKEYLTKDRQIDASRFTTINGGYRDTDYIELWVVPPGAQPPTPTPTAQPNPGRQQAPVTNRRSRHGRRE
jgi:hypothetical protein